MSSQALRSVCSRARPEVFQTGRPLANYFRSFSTTQSQSEEAGNPPSDGKPKPSSVRQRGREAATVINSLLSKGPRSGARPQRPADSQNSQQQPKVLDVKSLPRGIGRGNRFTPRGGAASTARGGTQTGRPGVNRFSRGGAAGAAASRGRGGAARGGRGRGGAARGGRGGGRRNNEDGKDGKKEERVVRGADPFEKMDAAETELDNTIRFGVAEQYEPKMDVNSVLEFAPASGVNAAGRRAAVLQELSTLGAAERVGTPIGLSPKTQAENLEAQGGITFFASTAEKAAVEAYLQDKKAQEQQAEGAESEGDVAAKKDGQPIIGSAEESVRQVVFDSAVAGKHEAPAFATDLHSIVRSLQIRSGSYRAKDMQAFMAKLEKLAGPPKPAAPDSAPDAAPKAKKAATTKKTTKKEATKEAKA